MAYDETIPPVIAQAITHVSPDTVFLHPENPNEGDIPAIIAAIRRVGFVDPIVVQESTRYALSGNHRLQAAKEIGLPSIPIVVVPFDDDEALAYLLAANEVGRKAKWNDERLLAALQKLNETPLGLDGTGFAPLDFSLLGRRVDIKERAATATALEHAPAGLPTGDAIVTRLGDRWEFPDDGGFVICGDATDPEVLDALFGDGAVQCLLTDPPYGIDLDTDWSGGTSVSASAKIARPGRVYPKVIGDGIAFDPRPIVAAAAKVREQFWFGADYYRSLLLSDDRSGSWLVWDKRSETTDDVIGSGFELCWSKQPHQRRVLRHFWSGAFGGGKGDRERFHPTQKPASVLCEILERWAPKGVVADPYGGSGSTLVAASIQGIPARLSELSPAYVDVMCIRWQELTGSMPVRDGVVYDFTRRR